MRVHKHILALAFAVVAVIGVTSAVLAPPLQSSPFASLNPLLTNSPVTTLNAPRAPLDRLPRNVVPRNYALRHHPILDAADGDVGTAPGHVTITVEALLPATNSVTLHLDRDLVEIHEDDVRITSMDGNNLGPVTHNYEPEKDFYTITLGTAGVTFQPRTMYKVEIGFTTKGASQPFGMWVTMTPDPDQPGVDVRMSVTILEPNFARRVLPCFDEPDLKATFDITIGHGLSHQSLTHTEIQGSDEVGGVIWDVYVTTPPMSVYLLCLVVAPNHYAAATDTSFPSAPVASWAPRRLIDAGAGDLSAQTVARSLAYFQTTYAPTSYSLSKLDSIVIPGFPAGALENWGINTYVEASLMYTQGETTELQRGRMTSTQHHEVSHQWFGNLVTCRWWDDIWLNEGLANYQSFKGVAATNPEFDPETLFVSDSVQVAMRVDQASSTHPIHFPILPDSWMDIFDTLSYSKGGSLIRMLEHVLSQDVLIRGLKQYLETWEFDAAGQDDLFESIDRAVNGTIPRPPLPAGVTVKSLMQGWTLQAGYPLVRVSSAGTGRIYVSQERFSVPRGSGVASLFWDIPVKITHKNGGADNARTTPDLWLRSTTSLTSYGSDLFNTRTQWIMANPDAGGFYRVHYDTHLFSLILGQLETAHGEISPGSRSQLVDDYWNMQLAGYVDLPTALQLTRYLAKEDHLVVWTPVLYHLRPYYTRLSGTPGFLSLQHYLLPRLEAVLDVIGWTQAPGDMGNRVILRANLLDWACGLGAERCFTEAQTLFAEYQANADQINVIIPVDIQASVLCAAVSSLGAPAHTFLLDQYKSDTTPVPVRGRLLGALACASDAVLLESALEDAGIRPADRLTLIQRVADNPDGREVAFEYAKETVLAGGLSLDGFANVIGTLAGYWYTEGEAETLQAFVTANEVFLEPVLARLNGHLARVRENGVWMDTKGKVLAEWMMGEAK